MVQHWCVAKAEEDKAEDDDVGELMRWLCGKWCDQKGSSYEVSISEVGSICLVTTRQSGEVINSIGLIRADTSKAGRIVWGRVGARLVYVLEKQNSRSLRWHRIGSDMPPFDWQRQERVPSHDDPQPKDEQRRARWGESCALLRHECRDCAEGDAIDHVMTVLSEQLWQGGDGETYEISPRQEKNAWNVIRRGKMRAQGFSIMYDDSSCVIWWGSWTYFFDPLELGSTPSEIRWYGAKDRLKTKPKFVWKTLHVSALAVARKPLPVSATAVAGKPLLVSPPVVTDTPILLRKQSHALKVAEKGFPVAAPAIAGKPHPDSATAVADKPLLVSAPMITVKPIPLHKQSCALKELLSVTEQTHEAAENLKPVLSVKVHGHVEAEQVLQGKHLEEKHNSETLLEHLTSPTATKTSVPLGTPVWGDFQHQWHEEIEKLVQNLQSALTCKRGMWNARAPQYLTQIPVVGTAPEVSPNGFVSSFESLGVVA